MVKLKFVKSKGLVFRKNDFNVLISIPSKQFVQEKFLKVYSFVSDIEEKAMDKYMLRFSFINHSQKFNKETLLSDGYLLTKIRHSQNAPAKKTRRAQ